jgi:CHAT domain-containing protein
MTQLKKEQVLALLRTGTPGERIAFLRSLPQNQFRDMAATLMGSDNQGMALLVLGTVMQPYCFGGDPEVGAVLAAAAHERAVELWQTMPNHGLLPTTLSGFAHNHVKALSLLGRSEEVLKATEKYIPFYEKLGEPENLPSIKVLRIEALVNLRRIDEADAALQDQTVIQHPIAGIEAKRLQGWVKQYRKNATDLSSEQQNAPESPSSQDLLNIMKTAIGLSFEGEAGEELKQQVDKLDPNNRLNPKDPKQFNQLLDILNKGETFLARGQEDSDIAVRGRVRNASAIFVSGMPEKPMIHRSLADLEACLTWAREHRVTEIENDALWGMYLCYSRLQQPSEAADMLILLRDSLESLRRGIKDPLKRGGIFSAYKYLFNSLCEKLSQAGRAEDFLEAIESSKGRVIADRLTEQRDDVVADSAIYSCVARLPELARRYRFHYLTYFVDETCVYAAFVSRKGVIHAVPPIPIKNQELRDAAASVDPKQWSKLPQNVSTHLAPLAGWLDTLIKQGIVEKGDHICYSSDDDFNNIPLHYLSFRKGILLDWFSLSRVHSAFHLDHVLKDESAGQFSRFAGFVIPLCEDLDRQKPEEFLANLDAPWKWLKDHGLSGEAVRLADATLKRVTQASLAQRIIHFSTHGQFPKDGGNPFRDSFLLLADDNGLPDKKRLDAGTHDGLLTPKKIIEANLNLNGSHVSMMACVSGLAKEGIAGDALGLDWAFLQAGAASLISTHWSVGAGNAARFFTLFYQKWLVEKQSRGSAFRATMLELLNGDHSPESLRQWTAFSLTGDFR